MDEDDREKVDRMLNWATLAGAACSIVWGALPVYLAFRHLSTPKAVVITLMVVMSFPGLGAVAGLLAAVGFCLITRRQ